MPERASPEGRGTSWSAARPPVFLTSLVGRGPEIAAVAALVRTARLVSLVGPGGTGKTRLAAAVVGALEPEPPGELGWVDLAPVAEAELVARHVAAVLGLREHPNRAPEDGLIERIGAAATVLVLDNCEHVRTGCAHLADALLRSCPALRILTTTREPLGLGGEKAWRVPPLEVPPPGAPARDAAAVRLFAERAGDALPSFMLTESNLPAVARICRRLDGLPLAIELAAARVAVLPPEQLADRLDDMFRVLASRSEAVQPRHRTLRALVDWSHELLSPEERWLFARLAVFVGGFTLEAAERVVGSPEGGDVLELLAALVEKSLVVMAERDGEARYSMLETVRRYAAERLAEAPEAAADGAPLHLAHARHYADLVEGVAGERPWADASAVARLEPEHENLRAALSWTAAHGHSELLLRLAVSMREYWRLRGHLTEGLEWSRRAATSAADRPELDCLRARALVSASVHGRMMGEYVALQAWLAEAEAIARRADDCVALADALTQLGLSLRDRGALPEARRRLDEAVRLWREAANPRGLSTALGARASIALAEGDTASARALRAEAAEVARSARDREGEAYALIGLGEVARMEGDLDEARACNQRCLRLFAELGDDWHSAAAHHNLGWIEVEAGRDTASFEAFSACVSLFRAAGNPFGLTLALFGFARLLFRAGDMDAAAVVLAAASAHAERVGVRPAAPADVLACGATAEGIRAALSDEAREAASARGGAMTLAEGLDWAGDRLRTVLARAAPDLAIPEPPAPDRVALDTAAAPPAAGDVVAGESPDVRVLTLGPLTIFVDGRPLDGDAFGSSRPRELLLLLLCHPEGLTREQVGLAFWPDASAAQVKNSFHVMLHRLRKALGHPDWVVLEGDRYRLRPSLRTELDALRFEAELRAALALDPGHPGAEAALARALALYQGEFLEGAAVGDWHLERRDRLRRLHADGVLAHAGALLAADRVADAAEAYRGLLARDRLHEEAFRGLMICQARLGQRVQAIRLYETFSLLLEEELGADPDPVTVGLYERLQRSEAL